uniref:Uncharacterized protein n=1 Tax=Clandestinovirus TaxID=2831644 RepID=A0A8F8PK14_9VIRU|nr:hypothetical protein KOM_12_6 [Clandestinovirus]
MSSITQGYESALDVVTDSTLTEKKGLTTIETTEYIRQLNRLRNGNSSLLRVRSQMQKALLKNEAPITERSIDSIATATVQQQTLVDNVRDSLAVWKTQVKSTGNPEDDPSVQEVQRQTALVKMVQEQTQKMQSILKPPANLVTQQEIQRMQQYFTAMEHAKKEVEFVVKNAKFRGMVATAAQVGSLVLVGTIALSSANVLAIPYFSSYAAPLAAHLPRIAYEVVMTVIPAATEFRKGGWKAAARKVVTSLGTRYILDNVDVKFAIHKTVTDATSPFAYQFIGWVTGKATVAFTDQVVTGILTGVAGFKSASEMAEEARLKVAEKLMKERKEFDRLVLDIQSGKINLAKQVYDEREKERLEIERQRKYSQASYLSRALRVPIDVVLMVMKQIGYKARELVKWTREQSKTALITTAIVTSGIAAFIHLGGSPVASIGWDIVNGFIKNSAAMYVIRSIVSKTKLVPKTAALLEKGVLKNIFGRDIAKSKPAIWLRQSFEKMLGRQLDWELKVSTLVAMMTSSMGISVAQTSLLWTMNLENLRWLNNRWNTGLVLSKSYDAFKLALEDGNLEQFKLTNIFEHLFKTAGTINIGDNIYDATGNTMFTIKTVDYSSQSIAITLPTGTERIINLSSSPELDKYYAKDTDGSLIPIAVGNMILPSLEYYQADEVLGVAKSTLELVAKQEPMETQKVIALVKKYRDSMGKVEKLKSELEASVQEIEQMEKNYDSDMAYSPTTPKTQKGFNDIKTSIASSIVRSKTDFVEYALKGKDEQTAFDYIESYLGGSVSQTSKRELLSAHRTGNRSMMELVVQKVITVENPWVASEPVLDRITKRMIGGMANNGPTDPLSQWKSFIRPLKMPDYMVMDTLKNRYKWVTTRDQIRTFGEIVMRSMTIDPVTYNTVGPEGSTLLDVVSRSVAQLKDDKVEPLTAVQGVLDLVSEKYPSYTILQRARRDISDIDWEVPQAKLDNIASELKEYMNSDNPLNPVSVNMVIINQLSNRNVLDKNDFYWLHDVLEERNAMAGLSMEEKQRQDDKVIGSVLDLVKKSFKRHVSKEQEIQASSPLRNIIQTEISNEFPVFPTMDTDEWRTILKATVKADYFSDYQSVTAIQTQKKFAINSFNQGYYDDAIEKWNELVHSKEGRSKLAEFNVEWDYLGRELNSMKIENVPSHMIAQHTVSDQKSFQRGWWIKKYGLDKPEAEKTIVGSIFGSSSDSDSIKTLANQYRSVLGLPEKQYTNDQVRRAGPTSDDPGLVYVQHLFDERLPRMSQRLTKMKNLSKTIDLQVASEIQSTLSLYKQRQTVQTRLGYELTKIEGLTKQFTQVSENIAMMMEKYRQEYERYGTRPNQYTNWSAGLEDAIKSMETKVSEMRLSFDNPVSPPIRSPLPSGDNIPQLDQKQQIIVDMRKSELIAASQRQQLLTEIGITTEVANQIQSVITHAQTTSSGTDLTLLTKFAAVFGHGGYGLNVKLAFDQNEIVKLKQVFGDYEKTLADLQKKLSQKPELSEYAGCITGTYRMKWPSGEIDPPEFARCYYEAFAGSKLHTAKNVVVNAGAQIMSAIFTATVGSYTGYIGGGLANTVGQTLILALNAFETALMTAVVQVSPKLSRMIEINLRNDDPDPTLHFWRFVAGWACMGRGATVTPLCRVANLAPGKEDGIPIASFNLRDLLLSNPSLVDNPHLPPFMEAIKDTSGYTLLKPLKVAKALTPLLYNMGTPFIKTIFLGDERTSHLRMLWDNWAREVAWSQSLGRETSIVDYLSVLKTLDINIGNSVYSTLSQVAWLGSTVGTWIFDRVKAGASNQLFGMEEND